MQQTSAVRLAVLPSRLRGNPRRRYFRIQMANYIGSKFGQADHAKLVMPARALAGFWLLAFSA